jgi:peptidoglycan/xylan/chitin deacetylase (PgdA/CDA1 family)
VATSKGSLAKEIFARCLLWSGAVRAIRSLLWRDRVLILVYHDPKPEALDVHLRYLLTIAEPIELADVHRPSRGRPRVVVTIDDGHVGNGKLVDVFKAHGVRPTIYLCSRIAGSRRQFWWHHPRLSARRVEQLKRMGNAQRLAELAALEFQQDAEVGTAAALSARAIARMQPFVEFQSHGRFHPILTRCDNGECDAEIAQSRSEVETLVGRPCRHFAYPNGNYGEREIAVLKSAGYQSARTLDVGWNEEGSDPFRLKAVVVSDDSSRAWFAVQISGIPAYVRHLRGGSLFGRMPQFEPQS